MSTPRPPDDASRPDDLKQRYLQASAEQTVGPSARVRQAALAHAQMVAQGKSPASPLQAEPKAANRWNFALVASVAIAGISALLALQFDRSDNQDQEVVLGTPSVTVPPKTAQQSAARPPPTQLPPTQPPQVRPSAETAKQPMADSAAKTLTVPQAKPSANPPATAQVPLPNTPPDAKVPTAEAIARTTAPPAPPAPTAPAAPPMKSDSQTQSEKVAEGPFMRAAPPSVQNRSAAAPNAEFSAPEPARLESAPSGAQRGNNAGAPNATMKSRPTAETAAALPAATGEALRSAARSGQIARLEQALQQASAAQLNASDDNGRTPLMLATLGGHIGAVQRLLTAGADPSLTDAKGNTAAQMAEQLNYSAIRNLLLKRPVAE